MNGKDKIGFLVYPPYRMARRKNDSFDGLSNIGVYLLIDSLRRKGVEAGFCSVDNADKFDKVLVSFTSNLDILAYARHVGRHPKWKKPARRFITVGGGFGMQNPTPIAEWLDYAWFGRAENEIDRIINLEDHPSLMSLDNIKEVKVNQSPVIYPHEVELGTKCHNKNGSGYRETIMGCPNKCFYCHYSYARKYIKTGEHYNLSLYAGSQELDMFNVDDINVNCARFTVGLDGWSQRLRYIVNRKTSDEIIKNFIVTLTEKTKADKIFLTLYNIIGFETETKQDELEFIELLKEITPKLKKRMILIVHNTPLRPSPLTPVAYSAINLETEHKVANTLLLPEHPNLFAVYSRFMEMPFAQLESIVVERATEKTHRIFEDIVFNPKLNRLRSNEKLKAISRKHDLTPLIREYSTEEQLPTWFLASYTPKDVIINQRKMMKRKQRDEVRQGTH